jgi:hypothetical protein
VKKAHPTGAWGQDSPASLAQKASETSAPASRTRTMERRVAPLQSPLVSLMPVECDVVGILAKSRGGI